ncbi:iron transporter [Halobaculum sp. MBLA0143]|uniref:iron transporter n=1 Tax=Halobaculum sp. MBLA0143 TaxID=3079933 RepID=UPI0035242174
MDRRAFLRTGAAVGAVGLAGCLGGFETEQVGQPPIPEDRPDGVYVPSHVEGMAMVGTAREGDYAFGLTYSYAHRFWNVVGDETSLTAVGEEDDVHLMASVWDPETGRVLPETGLSTAIYRDGELVTQEAIYPMLSQPMGFHYGANFGLAGDGDYTVELSVGAVPTRKTGSFRGRFDEPVTVELPFSYSRADRDEIDFEITPDDEAATPGAVSRMEMEMLPDSRAPAVGELPGNVRGTVESDDAVLAVTVLDEPPAGVDGDGQYLAVSARTEHNRMLIPAMGLRGRLRRDGDTVFDGRLRRTLDPNLAYHYGAVVDGVESGDELELSVTVQPQTARHEGYETAFGGVSGPMPDATLTL